MKLDEMRKMLSKKPKEDNRDLDELLDVDELEAEVEHNSLEEPVGEGPRLALECVRVSFSSERVKAEKGFDFMSAMDAYRKFLRTPPTGEPGRMLVKLKGLRGHASNTTLYFPASFTFYLDDLREFVASMEAAGFIIWLPGPWALADMPEEDE